MGLFCWGWGADLPQTGQEATSKYKLVTKCPENIPEAGYKCLCLNARSIANVEYIDLNIIGITE